MAYAGCRAGRLCAGIRCACAQICRLVAGQAGFVQAFVVRVRKYVGRRPGEWFRRGR